MDAVQQWRYRRVEAGRALAWWRAGWQSFLRAPWMWLGLCVLGLLVLRAARALPFGAILGQWLSLPLFAFGAVFAAMLRPRRGPSALPAQSVAPGGDGGVALQASLGLWGRRFGDLLLVSLLVLLLAGALIVLLSLGYALIFGLGLSQLGHWVAEAARPGLMISEAGAMLGALVGWSLLVVLVLLLCNVLFWFVGTLVSLGSVPPTQALQLSVRAGWANLGALSLFTALLIPATILALLPAGLGMLVLFPVLSGASYASFDDVFGDRARGRAEAGVVPPGD